jgi:hypothetical protein
LRRNFIAGIDWGEEKDIPVVDEAARKDLQLLTIEMAFWTWIILREALLLSLIPHTTFSIHPFNSARLATVP